MSESEESNVHRVPIVVFIEVKDAIDLKDAHRVAASAINDALVGVESFTRGHNTWAVRVARVSSLTTALARGWITLFSSERAFGPLDDHGEDVLPQPRTQAAAPEASG